MKYYGDLHIHSRYSRATSSSLTIPALAQGAVRKGIRVLGTGDLTHPAWMKEIEDELVEAEPGLYRLRDGSCPTRFILTGEISTIYKQGDKVRKVHHVIGAPDIAAAKKISTSLAAVGNILSDGRPILGITSRNLLEIVLEAGEGTFLIPAHIWTPWFSAMGSKSGFDSIAECYMDLDPYIFAVETGLSSDPPMNWMVKSLDRYRLVSCSDAHSADKLGREATVFDTPLDYHAIRRAMATGEGLLGTVEFFPEEGKYHLDGHRDCGVVLEPHRTRELGGRCPVCGRPLTVGVLSRVEELAGRAEGERPDSAKPFSSLIPLAEIMAEIMQVATPTKKVMEAHEKISTRLGGELPLLLDTDPAEIASVAGETLALAVKRMRSGEVHKEAGYDGRFGRVRVFADNEHDMLFRGGIEGVPARKRTVRKKMDTHPAEPSSDRPGLNADQQQAAAWHEGHLAVIAGPGTGKTRVLVERIRTLMDRGETDILAVTFTTRAAHEIAERLQDKTVEVCTFHSLAARILRDAGIGFEVADEAMLEQVASPAMELDVKAWVNDLVFRQGTTKPLDREQSGLLAVLRAQGYYTYEGLIEEAMLLVLNRVYSHVENRRYDMVHRSSIAPIASALYRRDPEAFIDMVRYIGGDIFSDRALFKKYSSALKRAGRLDEATALRQGVPASDSVLRSRLLGALGTFRHESGAAGWEDAFSQSIRLWPSGYIHAPAFALLRPRLLSDSAFSAGLADAFLATDVRSVARPSLHHSSEGQQKRK